jgi:hypothetical protein
VFEVKIEMDVVKTDLGARCTHIKCKNHVWHFFVTEFCSMIVGKSAIHVAKVFKGNLLSGGNAT